MERMRFARLPVLGASVALVAVLAATSAAYGYHRDELYFRMLPPAWGYVDQPPLTPLLARATMLIADEVWALRIPAMLFAAAGVVIVALVARELGGDRRAQGFAAWGFAFAAFTLSSGHTFLTASFDLVVWPLIVLAVLRAVLRHPRWWLLTGVVTGVSMYNKLLVAMLLVGLAVGLAAAGPWRQFRSPWPYVAIVVALAIGAPNLVYQALNGWPQFAMGQALAADNAGEVRVLMWPFLLLLVGPPLVPFWVVGLVSLWRRRATRFLVIAFPVVLAEVFLAGSQFYYEYGLLACVFAAGCVPVARWSRGRRRIGWAVGAIAANGVVCAVLSLPLLPASVSPAPVINQTISDQIGWPTYVAQITAVTPAGVPVVAANYGEAGAVARYAPAVAVFGTQNALADVGRPADGTPRVITVGYAADELAPYFASCSLAARLDSGTGVDSEEQGAPVLDCSGPRMPWAQIWDGLRHLD